MNINAIIFPGQGAQFSGMGKDLYDNFETAKEMFISAEKSGKFNRNYRELCFDGSEEELQKTILTQPVIYIVNSIIAAIMKENGLKFGYAAGHSLGEYSALYAAEVFSFETGLTLIEKRAYYMNESAEETEGTMTAIMGLSDEQISELCENANGIVGPAGYNSPGQVVISGEKNAVASVIEKAKIIGAKKIIELKVSGAWHSKLMQKAMVKLEKEIEKTDFSSPKCKIISNYTASELNSVEEIKKALVRQLIEPVKWIQSVEFMIKSGVDTFYECGPKKVLTALIKRINSDVKLINISDTSSIQENQ
jgi:[acyl-carrier-protein] S-malonyltransferase